MLADESVVFLADQLQVLCPLPRDPTVRRFERCVTLREDVCCLTVPLSSQMVHNMRDQIALHQVAPIRLWVRRHSDP